MSFEATVTVLGGDQRQAAVATRIGALFRVLTWGVPPGHFGPLVTNKNHWQDAVREAKILVLPLPASPDSKHLYAPYCTGEEEKPPLISEVLAAVPQGALVTGGRLTSCIKQELGARQLPYFDYFEDERLQQKNAIPTAEGAVEILMHEIPRTVRGLPVGIAGFGRVGRALAALLVAMGARVTVAARRAAALQEAAAMGCEVVMLNGPAALTALATCAAVFNTVPQQIFTAAVLSALPKEQLLVDLASTPGGFESAALSALGRRVIYALSLPGKYAPLSAGEIIAETVLTHIARGGLV